MKIKFQGIMTIEAALKAVERNGYALQYVLNLEMFMRIAARFGIEVEQ